LNFFRDLANKDAGGLSDPICVVYGFTSTKAKKELGRTEYIMNNQNPQFKRKIGLKFHPDEDQTLEFRLYDVDFLQGAEVSYGRRFRNRTPNVQHVGAGRRFRGLLLGLF
jgi:hypothetical protein